MAPGDAGGDGYIARMSYLMRQGEPANQVAILLPTDDAWATFSPTHTTVTGALQLKSGRSDAGDFECRVQRGLHRREGGGLRSGWGAPGSGDSADRPDAGGPRRRLPLGRRRAARSSAIGKLPTMTPDGKPLSSSDTAAIPVIPDAAQLEQALHNAAAPDFKLGAGDEAARTQLGFIRRKMASGISTLW